MKFIIIAIVIAVTSIVVINMNTNYAKAIINGNEITLEIVTSLEDQRRGLSNRDSLEYNSGMLFVYKDLTIRSFWMKEMEFPIDILWIDENNMIIGIEENVLPDSFPDKFISPEPVRFVLELIGGWSVEHDVKIGDLVDITIY